MYVIFLFILTEYWDFKFQIAGLCNCDLTRAEAKCVNRYLYSIKTINISKPELAKRLNALDRKAFFWDCGSNPTADSIFQAQRTNINLGDDHWNI